MTTRSSPRWFERGASLPLLFAHDVPSILQIARVVTVSVTVPPLCSAIAGVAASTSQNNRVSTISPHQSLPRRTVDVSSRSITRNLLY